MLERNIIDLMMDFLKRKWGDGLEIVETEENLKQYIAFQFLHGNVLWTNNERGEITGLLIAFPCDEEEAPRCRRLNWNLPKGKNCIYVSEMVADDERSRNLLAYGFLQRFPERKKAYAERHGKVVEMRVYDIAKNFSRDVNGQEIT